MTFTPSDDEQDWMTLEQMREELKRHEPSRWRHSRIYEDTAVAVEKLGIAPSEFDEWEQRDKVFAIAYYRANATVQAFEHYLANREMQRKGGAKGGPKGGKR